VIRLVSVLRVEPDPGDGKLETALDQPLGTVEVLDQVDLAGKIRARERREYDACARIG
jgi:hypothetical protein